MLRMVRVLACCAFVVLAACGSTTTTQPTSAPDMTAAAHDAATPVATTDTLEAVTAAPTIALGHTAPALEPTATDAARVGGSLTVFAAASLTDAFSEIGKGFMATNPGTTITFNFAGSQQLAQQIANGAPADVFASANTSQMNGVIANGNIVTETQQTFARNRLVVVFPPDNPAGIATLADLANPGVKLDFAGKEVPVGRYSLDVLDKAVADPAYGQAYKDAVLANIVSYEENVRAVLTKIKLGEADAGIVYSSDLAQQTADQVGRLEIPDALNTIASYPIAPLGTSDNPELAERFIAYVLSDEGKAVLTQNGFLAP